MNEETIRILKVEPGKAPEVCVIQNTLEALQQAVGGLIEFLQLDPKGNIDLMCNEEGKQIGLDGNRRVGSDIIVGNFYIMSSDADGNCCSLSDEQIEHYKKEFKSPEKFTKEEIEATLSMNFYCELSL